MIGMIFTVLLAIIFAEALWQVLLTFWNWITYERKKGMSDKYATLDEFLNERGDFVKQVVYKVDGDFNGDIKGDNVTVILMGNGDFKGDINSKDGTVFLNKGNVIGDVKANKVLCPIPPTKCNTAKGVKSPTSQINNELTCLDCIHCHFGLETMYCNASNKTIRHLTPCIRFEGK